MALDGEPAVGNPSPVWNQLENDISRRLLPSPCLARFLPYLCSHIKIAARSPRSGKAALHNSPPSIARGACTAYILDCMRFLNHARVGFTMSVWRRAVGSTEQGTLYIQCTQAPLVTVPYLLRGTAALQYHLAICRTLFSHLAPRRRAALRNPAEDYCEQPGTGESVPPRACPMMPAPPSTGKAAANALEA